MKIIAFYTHTHILNVMPQMCLSLQMKIVVILLFKF